MNKPIEKILINLLSEYLQLPETYGKDKAGNDIPVFIIRGQNIDLGKTVHLQMTISTIGSNVFANNKELYTDKDEEGNENFFERVMLNEQKQMQIDCYSRNNEARERFWEVQACLNSTLAEQYMDKYQFRIAKISNSYNMSGQEGGSDINRYTIRFNCITWNTKVTKIDYYDKFPATVQDDKNLKESFNIDKSVIER